MAIVTLPLRCSACETTTDLTQDCPTCFEALCPTCYGHWMALSCQTCRAEVRRRRLEAVA